MENKTLEERVANLETYCMALNEQSIRTDLRLSAYISFLIKKGAFSVDELESVKGIVDKEIEKMKQPVEQDKKEA